MQLTGFLDRRAQPFVAELWQLLLDAQTAPHGIPRAFVEKKKEELVSHFRAMDPEAEVDVTHDSRGKYVVNKISFNGHLFVCPVAVNPYSDVKDIVRTATSRCLCC